VAGDGPDARSSEEAARGQNDGLCSIDDCLAQGEQDDLVEAILRSIDNVRSPELRRFINGLVVRTGDSSLAAQQVGLSPRPFYLKVRTLGRSIKDLITNLRSH
jgi:hypothetical protein